MDADLFRLHELPRCLPDRAEQHRERSRHAEGPARNGRADLHHRRSRPRHPVRHGPLCRPLRQADHWPHRNTGAGRKGRAGIPRLCRPPPDQEWRLQHGSQLHLLRDGQGRPLPTASSTALPLPRTLPPRSRNSSAEPDARARAVVPRRLSGDIVARRTHGPHAACVPARPSRRHAAPHRGRRRRHARSPDQLSQRELAGLHHHQ